MVRQREFDTDKVLLIVMDLFWQRGYANTSMKDIVQATGIQPGSLYAAFGDKEKLFQQAFRKYTQEFFLLPSRVIVHLWSAFKLGLSIWQK